MSTQQEPMSQDQAEMLARSNQSSLDTTSSQGSRDDPPNYPAGLGMGAASTPASSRGSNMTDLQRLILLGGMSGGQFPMFNFSQQAQATPAAQATPMLNQSVMNTRRITPPMVRNLLRNRLRNRAHIISSETNAVDWVVRVRFENVQTMMAPLDQSREREGLLCHRVISVMLDTIAISGHVHISGAHVGTTEDDEGEKIYTCFHKFSDM